MHVQYMGWDYLGQFLSSYGFQIKPSAVNIVFIPLVFCLIATNSVQQSLLIAQSAQYVINSIFVMPKGNQKCLYH